MFQMFFNCIYNKGKKIVIIHTEIFKMQTRVLNYLIETNSIFGTTIDGAERTLDFLKKKHL